MSDESSDKDAPPRDAISSLAAIGTLSLIAVRFVCGGWEAIWPFLLLFFSIGSILAFLSTVQTEDDDTGNAVKPEE